MAAPAHLVDSNILLRIARRDDPDHAILLGERSGQR
jgi:hypothetical protein